MTRVLTITCNDPGLSWGPAVHFLELWNNIASDTEIDVDGVAPSWTRLPAIIRPVFNLRLCRVPDLPWIRQLLFDLFAALLILARYRRYDLLYVRASHWHLLTIQALRLAGCPYFLELNGMAKDDSVSSKKSPLFSQLIALQEKALVGRALRIIAVSDGIKRLVEERYGQGAKTRVIRNGVSDGLFKLDRQAPATGSPRRVIYVGTFTAWDGCVALPALASRFPDCQFMMIGDGCHRKEVELAAPANMRFKGLVPYGELERQYADADCAIVLYEYERHSNVELSSLKTLEYVAAGLPIFSTDVPGQEFIEAYGIGYLARQEEAVDQAFSRFLDNLGRYAVNCAEIRQRIRGEVSWRRVAMETGNLINDCAASFFGMASGGIRGGGGTC